MGEGGGKLGRGPVEIAGHDGVQRLRRLARRRLDEFTPAPTFLARPQHPKASSNLTAKISQQQVTSAWDKLGMTPLVLGAGVVRFHVRNVFVSAYYIDAISLLANWLLGSQNQLLARTDAGGRGRHPCTRPFPSDEYPGFGASGIRISRPG